MAAVRKSRALIDTSALLALANPRDQYHTRAVQIARSVVQSGRRLVGTTLILAEFQAHLLYRTDTARARSVVSALFDDPLYEWLDVPADLVRTAFSAWIEKYHDQQLSLTDAVSFEVMARQRIDEAFAFDQHFVTVGFTQLV